MTPTTGSRRNVARAPWTNIPPRATRTASCACSERSRARSASLPTTPYRLLFRPIVGGPGTSLYRRVVFDEVGGFDPAVPGYEDWDLQLGVLEHGYDAAFVPEVTLEYRKHERSALSADRSRHREIFAALRSKHRALYDRAPELAKRSELGAFGRLAYRSWWAWRPLPARAEQALYRLAFRR